MNNKLKSIIKTIVLIITIFFAGKYILGIFFEDMCGNDIIKKVNSPNGEKVAYIFNRDCGATTSVSYQLSILDKGDKFPNKTGNTIVSDKVINIEWLSENKIKVIYEKEAEISKMDKSVNGIKVVYVEK